ncbi:hypothetical protein TWF730_008423 [Orbilia blumenaviensis]|uniref:Uncharacterized protein n=1 Tax=Orbilia blumenaviensis TaxID=1796055 RepID=A0AAV9V2K8_9PEZI
MDFTWQDLVNYLSAPAGAIPQEIPGIYLLSEEDNCLIEKLRCGSEVSAQVFIAEDVRTNTPAVYLLNDDTRLVFYVDTEDVLRHSRYDTDEEEWQGEGEGEGDVIIPRTSKLSGCFTSGGQMVFFQNQSGLLQGVRIQGSACELLSPISAEPSEATPHFVIRSADENLYLFYIGRDRYIHYLIEGPEPGEWHDNVLRSPVLDQVVVNFMVIPDKDMNFEAYLLTTDMLVGIDKYAELMDFGKVRGGKFTASSGKECIIESIKLIKEGVKLISGKVSEAKKKRKDNKANP